MKAKKTLVLLVLLIISAINIKACPIPDKGQTKCYDKAAENICPKPGSGF